MIPAVQKLLDEGWWIARIKESTFDLEVGCRVITNGQRYIWLEEKDDRTATLKQRLTDFIEADIKYMSTLDYSRDEVEFGCPNSILQDCMGEPCIFCGRKRK